MITMFTYVHAQTINNICARGGGEGRARARAHHRYTYRDRGAQLFPAGHSPYRDSCQGGTVKIVQTEMPSSLEAPKMNGACKLATTTLM